jgi:hypothetical protein
MHFFIYSDAVLDVSSNPYYSIYDHFAQRRRYRAEDDQYDKAARRPNLQKY